MPQAKESNLADIVELGKAFFIALGDAVVDRIVLHTTKSGKDHKGRKFKPLSDKPQTPYFFSRGKGASRKVMRAESYKQKKARGGFDRQASTGGANLQLSGDMMADLQPSRPREDSITLSWPTHSERLIQNKDNGRIVTSESNPVAPGIERFIQKEVDKRTKKNIKAQNKVNVIKLGK